MSYRIVVIALIGWFGSIQGFGQDSLAFEIEVLKNVQNFNDQLTSQVCGNLCFVVSPNQEDYISSWNLEEQGLNRVHMIQADNVDFENPKSQLLNLGLSGSQEIGTVSFSERDSSFVYSVFNGGKSSIYIKTKEQEPSLILKAKGRTNYFHPFITADGTQVFFSSNLDNQAANYDLFYVNKLSEGWSSPIRLGSDINTPTSQLFPTWYDDTLYYSSQENGTLHLNYSSKRDQYKVKKSLPAPFNSDHDDFLLHKKNNDIFYLTSNRNDNTDNPFLLKRKVKTSGEKMIISGYLACTGNRISNVPLSLTNHFGIKIDHDVTDGEGRFLFRSNKTLKKYKLKLERKDPRTKDCAVLYLTDSDGNVLQKIMINDEGDFVFETLDTEEIEELNLISAKDESLLQIEIDGQVYESVPGDLGKSEPIKILSEDGTVMALAYTSEDGKFSFKDLSPEAQYTFSFDENSRQLQLGVIKDGTLIPVPIKNNEAIYQRIKAENSIDLIDEHGKSITIEKDEFFRLQNIFYEYNSSELSEIAKFQLDRFAQFIFNNDEITIELISHTDSRGESSYNLSLSEKRAQQAIDYLVNKGVKAERMKGYGMGEKNPINHCFDGRECSESEHALNRRTEIRIIALD